jgi:hypothetical protein
MKKQLLQLSIFLVAGFSVLRADQSLDLINGGFEDGLTGWSVQNYSAGVTVVADAKKDGAMGARLTETAGNGNPILLSKLLPATPGKTYEVKFWARVVSGAAFGAYIHFFNTGFAQMPSSGPTQYIDNQTSTWTQFDIKRTAPDGAMRVAVAFQTFTNQPVVVDVDSVSITELDSTTPAPAPKSP